MTAALTLLGLFVDAATAQRLIESGHMAEALNEIERMVKSSPGDPETQFEAGELLRQLGALRAERLRTIAPHSREAHELAGRALEVQGKLAQALAEYRLAHAHFLSGNVLWQMRDLDAAEAEFSQTLDANPNHVLANLRLGQILAQRNQPREAIVHFRSAIAGDATLLQAHRELGKTLRSVGQYREALEELLMVAERRPNDDSVHALLAGVYRALGNSSLAAEQMSIHKRLLEKKDFATRTPR